MAIKVTRRWSGRNPAFRSAMVDTILFDVTGEPDPIAALSAADASTGLKPLQMNDLHPDFPTSPLLCSGPGVREVKSPSWYVVECPYAIPSTGNFEAANIPPLLQQPIITWTPQDVSEQVDVDYGMTTTGTVHAPRPIFASNLCPVGPGTREVTMWQLEIVKNAAYFDHTYAETYGNKVNSKQVILNGANPAKIAPEHMCCRFFGPATSYTANAKYVPMRVIFDVMFDDSLGKFPYQHRFMDQGTIGWYEWPVGSGTKYPAAFYNGDSPVSEPIRLDGSGKPLSLPEYSQITVGMNKLPPTTAPTAVDAYSIDTTSSVARFLYFSKKGNVDLNILLNQLLH